jgi:hypothetical protein
MNQLVGDTLTLPITIPLQNRRIAGEKESTAASEGPSDPSLPATLGEIESIPSSSDD